MSGKMIRSMFAVALLALVMTLNAAVPTVAPMLSRAGNSPATLAMEVGITKS
jgi:hypothetical protein